MRSASTKDFTNKRAWYLKKPKLSIFLKVSNEKLGSVQNFEILKNLQIVVRDPGTAQTKSERTEAS